MTERLLMKDWTPKKHIKHAKKKSRERCLKHHGLTPKKYSQLLKQQNNRCAICRKSQRQFKRNFHIDHSHKTGKIRGLLCSTCNAGVGYYEKWYKKNRAVVDKYLQKKA